MVDYVTLDDTPSPKMKFFKIGKYSFSTIEIRHLLIALFLITLTLIALRRGQLGGLSLPEIVFVFLVTVGLGFLLHELAHKFMAQHYGFISEFRADFLMMFLALGVAYLTGIAFIAPGAVMILGRVSRRQNGIIAVVGPITNLVLALIFLALSFFVSGGLLGIMIQLGIWINALLGVFNMLPFWVLDGKKVLAWSKPIYFLVLLPLVALLIIGFSL